MLPKSHGYWGRVGEDPWAEQPSFLFKCKEQRAAPKGEMLRLSGASPVGDSLCNRHRNNDNCLATCKWRRGAGRGPE